MSKKIDKKIQTVKKRIVSRLSQIPDMFQADTLKILNDILESIEDTIDHYRW